MKTVLIVLLIWAVTFTAWGGILCTIDNDFFSDADGSYSHGTELAWYAPNSRGIYFTGIRNQVYTPSDVTQSQNQPDDHPWAGLLTAFYDQGVHHGPWRLKYGVEAGVMGPASQMDEAQTWFHELVHSDKPEGWENQLRDEPVLNTYLNSAYGLGIKGNTKKWSLMPDLLLGGTLGTIDVNLYSGLGLRAGYNIPRYWPGENLDPAAPLPQDFFVYGLAEIKGIAVAHNATMGQSLFHGEDEEHHVDPKPLLGEVRGGLCLGSGRFSCSFVMVGRTDEFDGQERTPAWGEVTLVFGQPF